jgi:hypothetical protein
MSEYNQGKYNHNRKGDHLFICDVCGQKTWQSDSRVTWDGFLACISRGCWYPKHPADQPLPVITDPFVLPGQTIRPSPNWDNLPARIINGVSTHSHILPPMKDWTISQMFRKHSQFDDGVDWFNGSQDQE